MAINPAHARRQARRDYDGTENPPIRYPGNDWLQTAYAATWIDLHADYMAENARQLATAEIMQLTHEELLERLVAKGILP